MTKTSSDKNVQICVSMELLTKEYFLSYSGSWIQRVVHNIKPKKFFALRNINLKIMCGEKVGVIGSNGAGKTTLLSVIAGITSPTSGTSTVSGKVISIIDLEAGFYPELTGLENLKINGIVLGMNKYSIREKMPSILKLAGIGKFVFQPMFTYSDGMKLRLAFSLAAHSDFDVLVLDENISVGDQDFQKKSLEKIREFFKCGKTVIIATHYLDFIEKTCSRVIWLDKGRLIKDGSAKEVITAYRKFGNPAA